MICCPGNGGEFDWLAARDRIRIDKIQAPFYRNSRFIFCEVMMSSLRVMLLLAALGMSGFAVSSDAETQPATVLNKHLEKLLGTWTSNEGEVTFNTNSTIVYKGKKYYCAIAQGTIQISKHKVTTILPYRFLEGKLLITDGGTVTTYTRAP